MSGTFADNYGESEAYRAGLDEDRYAHLAKSDDDVLLTDNDEMETTDDTQ